MECTNGQELKIMDYVNQLFGTKRAKSTNEDYNFDFSDDSDNFDNNDDSDSDDSDSDRDNGTRQTVSSTSNTAKSYKANYLKKDATTSDSSKIVMKPVVKSSAKATLNNDPELKGKLKGTK